VALSLKIKGFKKGGERAPGGFENSSPFAGGLRRGIWGRGQGLLTKTVYEGWELRDGVHPVVIEITPVAKR